MLPTRIVTVATMLFAAVPVHAAALALVLRGAVAVAQQFGTAAEARAMLDRAVQLDNRLAAPYVSLGHLHSSLAKHDLALQEFQKALAINPRDPDAIMGVAGAYELMGRMQDAEERYKMAIALKPGHWDGYNSLANFYDRQGRYIEAVAQYQRVIELTPDNATAYSNLGAEYQSIGDAESHKRAESSYKKSIQISPTYAAYANLGNLYMDEKRYAEAAEATEKALQLNGSDYRVWINLLLEQRLLKDVESGRRTRAKALSLLQDFIQQHPQDATAQSWLAVLESEDKVRKESLEAIAAALAISPKDPLILANVAEAFQNLSDRGKALSYAHESLRNGFGISDLQSRPALEPVLADPSFRASGKN